MKHLASARLTNTVGKIFFLASVLFSIFEYATAVTAVGAEGAEHTVMTGFVLGSAALIFGIFGAFLFHQVSSVFLTFAEAEAKKAEEAFEGEDGLPAAFCLEIRAYSPAQLRLILDEQKDEYSAEEFAYIEKILAEKSGS
jgi:hypothetical protein